MIKYIGDGTAYFLGVPMRDLSDEEWSTLPDATRKALIKAKLFDAPAPEAKPAAQTTKSDKGGGG